MSEEKAAGKNEAASEERKMKRVGERSSLELGAGNGSLKRTMFASGQEHSEVQVVVVKDALH